MAGSDRLRKSKERVQNVLSEKGRVFVRKYLTPKGTRLLLNNEITHEEAWKKYGKNYYVANPNARIVKTITHKVA